MKKTFIAVSLLLISAVSFAGLGDPYEPEIDTRFGLVEARATSLESRATALEAKTKAGIFTVSTTKAAASTFSLGITIPANSLIMRLYARVKTLVVSANGNTVALGCGSGAGLLAATDYSAQSANYVLAATTTMPYLATSSCVVTGTVGAGASGITAGALEVYAQYLSLL